MEVVTKMVEVDYGVMSDEERQVSMTDAVAAQDWKAVKVIANAMTKAEAGAEKAKKDALQSVLAELTLEVKGVVDKAVTKLIDTGKLDSCDGVWYTNDFGEVLTSCRLTKKTARASTGGGNGGAGKKYDASTKDLLEQFGSEIDEKSGKTYQELADDAEGATDKKNATYRVRVKLLKKAGLVS